MYGEWLSNSGYQPSLKVVIKRAKFNKISFTTPHFMQRNDNFEWWGNMKMSSTVTDFFPICGARHLQTLYFALFTILLPHYFKTKK